MESLLKGTLVTDNPEQTQYAKVQEFFDQSFISWQHTTEYNVTHEFYDRRKFFIISILILSYILIVSYYQNK